MTRPMAVAAKRTVILDHVHAAGRGAVFFDPGDLHEPAPSRLRVEKVRDEDVLDRVPALRKALFVVVA